MIGFLYALGAAVFVSLRMVLEKRMLRDFDEFFLAWGLRFFGFIFTGIVVLLYKIDISIYNDLFWKVLLLGGILNSISSVLAMKALKISDISLVAPIVATAPFFVLFLSFLILKEVPSFYGLCGIFLIVVGTYFLNIREQKKGYTEPLKVLLRNKGVRYMFIVVLIWSLGANVDKIGLQTSSPLVWALAIQGTVALFLAPIILFRKKLTEGIIGRKQLMMFPLLGLIAACGAIFHVYAMSIILVVYAVSIKRLSVVFEVIMGRVIFKEEGIKERLAGVLIMLIGTVLIAFS
jgi:drug/metabolite transporter (DMT)-like permease